MTNIYTSFISITFVLLCLTACNNTPAFTKKQYITKFESFIVITESSYMNFDDDGWKKANSDFKELSETEYSRFEKEITTEEQLKIDKLIGRYYSYVAKFKAAQLQNKLKRIYNQAEGFIENVTK
ncbi:MAG: DUF6565 domain-containing protein [Ferruginibacter sp.]